tara:strand:+ start:701 stop:994 length:294 start_codon:yes stop_codon:yes gene_type:complete
MWWVLFVIFALVSITSSILLFFSLKRITQYEELILQFQQIISFSSEKMKQADTRGHYQSDDETSFFFEQLKSLQKVLDGVFETENLDGEKNNAKKKK